MKKKTISRARWGYLFILPFFLTYLIFSFIPLVDTIRNSFFEYYRSGLKTIGPNFVGLENYIKRTGQSEPDIVHTDYVAEQFPAGSGLWTRRRAVRISVHYQRNPLLLCIPDAE